MTNSDHSVYIVEIDQNSKKCLGDVMRFAVTDSSKKPSANAGVKNSQINYNNNHNNNNNLNLARKRKP